MCEDGGEELYSQTLLKNLMMVVSEEVCADSEIIF